MKKVIVLSAAFVALSLTSCGEKKTEPAVDAVDTAAAPATEETTTPAADTAAPTADTAAPAATPAAETAPAH
ncbi:hypothetical protein AM493_17235 [Flavobacterium akiainvivens]|uniref:Lipoprotein n=2 Tax=Flavobacterium akiainvivens TaxID=1202724 RepID=A0A0M8MGI4_9FLAO|nr:hypothetical protein AM493_17235 [Flavobacterium akiainvivens]